MALVIAQEEKLNIEKLLDIKKQSSDEMDGVFQGFKEDGFERSLQKEDEETATDENSTPDETEDETSNSGDEEETKGDTETAVDDESKTTEDSEAEAEVAEEAFFICHYPAVTAHIALESSFNHQAISNLQLSQETVGEAIGSAFAIGGAAAGMVYHGGKATYHGLVRDEQGEDKILMKLSKLGFTFGKAGLKHFAKGLLFALLKTAEGITDGGKALYRYTRKRQQSYQRFLDQINKARAILKIIQASKKELPAPELYDDKFVISSLKVGNDLSFLTHFKTLTDVNQIYNSNLVRHVQFSVTNIKKVMNQVLSGKISLPKITCVQEIPLQGLKKSEEDNNLIRLTYNKVLPGDHLLYFVVPNESLTDYEQIKSAYHQSHSDLTINESNDKSIKDCRLLNSNEIENYLNVLETLCQQGLALEHAVKDINRLRSSLKPSLSSYMDYLANKEHNLSIKESLAEYVSLKTHFLDHVVIGGILHLQDLNVSVLSAGMKYVRDSLTQYQD